MELLSKFTATFHSHVYNDPMQCFVTGAGNPLCPMFSRMTVCGDAWTSGVARGVRRCGPHRAALCQGRQTGENFVLFWNIQLIQIWHFTKIVENYDKNPFPHISGSCAA